MRITAVTLCLLAVIGLASGCATRGVDRSGPALRIGHTPNYPPIVYRDEDRLIGVEPELGEMLANELRREPEWVELPWEELIPSLERGEIDVIMSGMSVTPERSKRVLFTEPYMRVGQLGLIRRSDVDRYGHPSAIGRRGARVGYVRGTTGEALVRSRLRDAESYGFDDSAAGIRSLRAGRIDFFVHDAPTVWRVTLDPDGRDLIGLFRPLTEEYLAWAVRPDDPRLKQQLDRIIDDWRAQNRLEPVLDRWIPVRVEVRD